MKRIHALKLDQPTFGLHRSYLVNPETHKTLLEAYKTYIVEAAQELGSTEESIEVSAQAILEFEIKLANISLPDELHLDAEYIYNPYTLSSFQSESDAIDSSFKVVLHRQLMTLFSGLMFSDTSEIYYIYAD
jgi:predicted metalloendopeptidase